jgi:lipopolysaccharide transport system ATP-binding protein
MSSNDFAIRVTNLSKRYEIYANPRDRLKQFIAPRLQRLAGQSPKQYFRDFWALNDVSFEVKKGETVGIIGRNGSGKSTLLQMICGTLSPTSGSVETNGRIAALLELGSGFNPEFTGRENVYMNASVLGLNSKEIDARFDDIAAFADIGQFIEQTVKTYSSGMMVRLAFAVIAHVDADILVVDEALAVGDAFFTQKCMRFLRKFMENGTVLFVSHDTGAVLSLCDSAIWLQMGRLRALGSPKALTNEYMQALYEEQSELTVGSLQLATVDAQELSPVSSDTVVEGASGAPVGYPLPRDMRENLINGSTLRNDIELFAFQVDAAGFGEGQARIVSVRFDGANGQPLSWIVGGEEVSLTIDCDCEAVLWGPIVGFNVKDRLGQVLFGDNTWLATQEAPLRVAAGRRLRARFTFTLPRLPSGDYSVSAAIAEGSAVEHRQQHWMHDALTFKVHASSVYTGLVGIPMININLAEVS